MAIGVTITERDLSLYNNSMNTNPCLAVVGTATKGPIGVPTLCTTQKELKSIFGAQDPNCLGIYAANFALSLVNKCYYVRVANETALAQASVGIPGTLSESTVENLITIAGDSSGTFYNGYKIKIENAKPESFDISVYNAKGALLYNYKGVSLDPTKDNYVGDILLGSCVRLKEYSTTVDIKTYTLKNGDYILANGNDGITGATSADYVAGLDTLLPDTISAELIATPGVSDPTVILKGLKVAESRGNSLYLVDPPKGYDYQKAVEWHNGKETGEGGNTSSFNSSYGAMYWSWQYIYDEVNAQEVLVPPSVVVPSVIARSDSISQPWYAPAGLTRGLIYNVVRSEFVPSSEAQDFLYTDPNNINPIITHPTSGLVVFGQKTLWRQPTSLNRINVRRLVTYIKNTVKNITQHLTFEPNDTTTWSNFYDLVDPVLRNIQENRGLYEYLIVKGENNVTEEDIDNYRMPLQILIKPTKSAEYIPVDLVITSTGTVLNTSEENYADEF